jgi:SAM-dependent methyltransferase
MDYHERIVPGGSIWKENAANHMQRYRYACQFVSGMRVLDAACGVGYGSQILLRAGAREVLGVDIAQDALEIARKQFSSPGLQFMRDDCESLTTLQGSFDVVVAFECVEHFQRLSRFLDRVRDLLRDSGVLVCSTPNPRFSQPNGNGKPSNPFHVREYALDEFRDLLQEYFGDVSIAGQGFTAAYRRTLRLSELQGNPFMRLGRIAQRLLRGRGPANEPIFLTEGDYVISEANPEDAFFFVAVCRHPRRN